MPVLRWTDFTGGLWLTEDSEGEVAPPNTLAYADNVDFLPAGSVRGRRGTQKYNTNPLVGTAPRVRGMVRHYPRDPATPAEFLIAVDKEGPANRLYWRGTGAGFDTVSQAFAVSPHRPRFVAWPAKDATFIFDGVNPVQLYSALLVSQVPLGPQFGIQARRGPYAALWQERLWATDPDELSYSVYASVVGDEREWNPALHLAVNDPQGGAITGLVPLGDRLLILKETSLWYFMGDPEFGGAALVRYADLGCLAPDTIAVTPWGVVFLARDGLRITDGQNPEPPLLSTALRPLFVHRTGVTTYPTAFGFYVPRHQQYWLCLDGIPAGRRPLWWGQASGRAVLVLHRVPVDTDEGPVDRLPWSAYDLVIEAACTWDGGRDAGEVFAAGNDGFVRQLDIGISDALTSSESAIYVAVQPSRRALDPQRRGRRGRVRWLRARQQGGTLGTYMAGVAYREHVGDPAEPAAVIVASDDLGHTRFSFPDTGVQARYVAPFIRGSVEGPNFELRELEAEVRLRTLRGSFA